VDWGQVAKEFWDQQPHPRAPNIQIKDYATAVKLATLVKFGGHASSHETSLFWPEFKATGMSPQEFEHAVERIAPVSFTFHGRPPSMQEIVQLKDKHPKDVNSYFGELPDKHYPNVPAAEMVKHLAAAEPHAREHLGRAPVKLEAAYLHASGEQPANYYSRLAQPQVKIPDSTNGVQTQERGDDRGRGLRVIGGQAPDQRDSPDRRSGVSA
jgi:hypothetical protein